MIFWERTSAHLKMSPSTTTVNLVSCMTTLVSRLLFFILGWVFFVFVVGFGVSFNTVSHLLAWMFLFHWMVLDASLQPLSQVYRISSDVRLLVRIRLEPTSRENFVNTQQQKNTKWILSWKVNMHYSKFLLKELHEVNPCNFIIAKNVMKKIHHKFTMQHLHR